MDVRTVIIAWWRPFRRCWITRYVPLYRLSVLVDLVRDIAVLVFDLLAGLLVAQARVCTVVAREPAAELADQHDRPR